jgi:deoxycytidylate deaminase
MKFNLKATIIKSGRVISTGSNSSKSLILGFERGSKELWNANNHAEKVAILKALKLFDGLHHLAGSTIYVTRYNKNGDTRLAKPCKYCQELIESVGIKKVVYTTDSGTDVIIC